MNTLLDKVKNNNFESLRKLTREHTNYYNMIQGRRYNQIKPHRRQHYSNNRFKFSSKNVSKDFQSNNSITESGRDETSLKTDHKEVEPEAQDENALKFDILSKSLEFEKCTKRCHSADNFYYEKLSLEEKGSIIHTVVKDEPAKVENKGTDVIIQTDDIELYKICNNNYLYSFSQNMYLSPVEERLMSKLNIQSQTGSRQNKIISLLMNNNEYNLRVQNIIHSDKLNSLVDNEYFMSMYYNSLYEKIDKLLGKNDEDFGYVTQQSRAIDSEFEENDFVEDEFFDSDENTTTPRKERRGGISIKGFKSKDTNFLRKNPIQRNNKPTSHTPSKFKKKLLDNPLNDIDNEEEKRLYEETKALLDEEIDGFDDDEVEAELPRRINEAIENLNERLKVLKKDEFGDPIIENGYLEEPQGKNLQLSALRLANLMSMLFKKNPIPEFNEHVRKLLK